MSELAFDEFNLPTCPACRTHWLNDQPLTGPQIFAYFKTYHLNHSMGHTA